MAERPRDIAIDANRDIFLDDTNDLALVSGDAQLEQSVAIDVLDETQTFIGGKLTSQNVSLLEERMREALDDDPQIGDVISVTIDEYDRRNNSITASVRVTENDDFTITVNA